MSKDNSDLSDAERLSDRELDALVHQRVMGLQCKIGCPSIIAEASPPEFWRPADDYLELDEDGSFKNITYVPGGAGRLPIPEYSKSIAAAFTIVERMREQGWRFRLDSWNELNEEVVIAQFFRGLGGPGDFNESLPSSRAICLAALSALKDGNVSAKRVRQYVREATK